MARQGGQRSREGAKLIGRWFANHGKVSRETEKGPCPGIAELWNAFQRSTLSPFLISRQFVCLGKDGKPTFEKLESSFFMQSTGHGCVNDGNRIIIIILSVKKECPVDSSPQIRIMNVFPHEKKSDMRVLLCQRHPADSGDSAQTYRFPNRSLGRWRQGALE